MKEPMSADLSDQVYFDMPSDEADEYGGTISGWVEQFSCPAKITHLRGGEAVQAARLEGRQPVLMHVRRNQMTAGITTTWRARWGGMPFNIRDVEFPSGRKWVVVFAESGVAV